MRSGFLDDEELTFFEVGLDDLTMARLMEVCDGAHASPSQVLAAIVRDVLEDDANQHDPNEPPDSVRRDAHKDLN